MAGYELKTRPSDASVAAFLDAIADDQRQQDCRTLHAMMARVTGCAARMWGDSIVGFGRYHSRYASGHEGDWFITGFASRKKALTIYIMPGYGAYDHLMEGLGRFRTGKACLYLRRLDDVDPDGLERLIATAFTDMQAKYNG